MAMIATGTVPRLPRLQPPRPRPPNGCGAPERLVDSWVPFGVSFLKGFLAQGHGPLLWPLDLDGLRLGCPATRTSSPGLVAVR